MVLFYSINSGPPLRSVSISTVYHMPSPSTLISMHLYRYLIHSFLDAREQTILVGWVSPHGSILLHFIPTKFTGPTRRAQFPVQQFARVTSS